MLLTLCTGNAARSVMAGVMLDAAPFDIVTAGTHVVEGQPVSRRTRSALASVGFASISHRSHQLTDADVSGAELIVAMAGEHVAYIRRRHPEASAKTVTLRRLCRELGAGPGPLAPRVAALDLAAREIESWEDVEDPAGGDDQTYLDCARELADLCADLLTRLY